MSKVTKLLIRAAHSFRNPESGVRRYAWAIVVAILTGAVVLVLVLRKRKINHLEAQVESLELESRHAKRKAQIAETQEEADELHKEALTLKTKAKKLRGEADEKVMEYLETDSKVKAAKDWESLKDMYENLD